MPSLQKISAQGTKYVWNISKQGNTLKIEWGRQNGKLQLVQQTVLCGKQGRSLDEQLDLELAAMIKKKISKDGYSMVQSEDASSSVPETVVAEETLCPLPMLAHTWTSKQESTLLKSNDASSIFIQPKLDGLRCLCDLNTGTLFSRSRHAFSLAHISTAILALPQRSEFIKSGIRYVDGEVYAHGMPFQEITSLARRHHRNATKESQSLQFHAYDCIHSDLEFAQRFQLLRDLLDPTHPVLRLCDTQVLSSSVDHALDKQVKLGYEGLMIRFSNSGYECGKRSPSLWKRKNFDQEEYSVLGFQKHAELDTLGSVLLKTSQNKTFSATPAVDAKAKLDLWTHRDEYTSNKWIATVKFQGLSKEGIPRFPVLIGFRHQEDC